VLVKDKDKKINLGTVKKNTNRPSSPTAVYVYVCVV